MNFGKMVKGFLILVGLLAILAWFGHTFQLKDPNQPRLPIPTEMPGIPHISVSKK